MARSKTTKSSETESVVSPTPVSVQVSAPVVEKAPKARVVKAKTPKVEVAPVLSSEPVVVSEDVVTETVPVADGEAPIAEQSIEFLAKLQQLGVLISSLKVEYRVLEKKWQRELKVAQKQSSKRKRKVGNRAPSGFVKPTRISDELAKFLEKPSGSEMARTEVTRDINKYIRTHNLQDKENGRKINPDTKLRSLLKLKVSDELTYFNLQKYMSPHFAKAVKAEVAVAM
jgi:upstream activation factor subunit UAF30